MTVRIDGTNSTANPAITGADTDTGLQFGTDEVSIVTDGTARATVDSSGRLLVGTSSSQSTFYTGGIQVQGTNSSTSAISIKTNQNDSGGPGLILAKSRGTSAGSNTAVQSGDEIGYIGFIGADGTDTETPAASISAQVDGTPGANDMPGRLVFSTTADGASSPTEAFAITNDRRNWVYDARSLEAEFDTTAKLNVYSGSSTSTGNVGIECAANTGSARYHISFSDSSGVVGSISTSGGATAYNTSSDYRLKENIVPLAGAIDRVNQLQVYRFNFIANPDNTVDGFIAHETQAIVPECVTGSKDEVDDDGKPIYQGIDQSKLVPLLTAALQEAIVKIEALEAKVTALEVD